MLPLVDLTPLYPSFSFSGEMRLDRSICERRRFSQTTAESEKEITANNSEDKCNNNSACLL